jgi:hypothetical protein
MNPHEKAVFRLRCMAEFLIGMIEEDRKQRGLEPSKMLENCQRILAEIDADLEASWRSG